MAKLTDNGLEWDKFGTSYSNLQQIAVTNFSSLLNDGETLSTDESSILGRILGIVADVDSSQEELIFQMYSSFDPEQAEGVYLEKLVYLFAGLKRKQPTPAIAGLMLRGSLGVTVPESSNVSNTKTGDVFTTDSDVTFTQTSANGVVLDVGTISTDTSVSLTYSEIASLNQYPPITIVAGELDTTTTIARTLVQTINATSSVIEAFLDSDNAVHVKFINFNTVGNFSTTGNLDVIQSYMPVTATSRTFSAVVQATNNLNVIQSPVLGWFEVYNPYDSIASTNLETDSELRSRYKFSKSFIQTGNRESMYAALYSLSGVRFVNVQENIQDIPFEGRSAHGIIVTVLGGDDQEVAQTIDKYRAFAYTDGSIEVGLNDINGTPYSVRFNRPEIVPVQIKLSLTTDTNVFPTDGMLRIQNALIDYISNLNVGEDVIWSKLFTPINTVNGQSVNNLQIGKVGQPLGTESIVIEHNQLASLSFENIT